MAWGNSKHTIVKHVGWIFKINVRKYRRGNQKRTIQRNWQNRVHKATEKKSKHNTICVGHHYTQTNTTNVNKTCTLLETNTTNVNKTCTLLQTTGGKDEPNIVNKTCTLLQTTGGKDEPNIVHAEIGADIMTWNWEGKDT